jgi:hypothetical protein
LNDRVNKVQRQLRSGDMEVVTLPTLRGACVTLAKGINGVQYDTRPVPIEPAQPPAIEVAAVEWVEWLGALYLQTTGAGAMAVNLTGARMLARYRTHGGSLTRAAFLSARNDVLANTAIIGAGLVTAYTASAAREVYVAARRELADAIP